MKREELDQIPSGTELLRSVRHTSSEDVAEITDDELYNAVRWLRAASYSAAEGARRLEAILRTRSTTNHQDPVEGQCTSDPPTTAPSTSTAEPPTATPPPPARRSPSSRKTTAPA